MTLDRIKHISAYGDMFPQEPATEEQISSFELKNKVKLPIKYRELLLFSDGGEWYRPSKIQFYGVAHKPIIDTTDDDKPNKDYIVIGRLTSGDPIVFKNGEERVSIYNLEGSRIENDETYDDFYEFLDDMKGICGI